MPSAVIRNPHTRAIDSIVHTIIRSGFYQQIGSPLLRDVKIKYIGESVDVTSLVSDDDDVYYDGSELVTIGRLSNNNDSDIDDVTVTANVSAISRMGKSTFEVRLTADQQWPLPGDTVK